MSWPRWILAVAVGALALAEASPAAAAAPETTRETLVVPSRVYSDCPDGQVVIKDLRVDRVVKVWTDEAGVETRESRHTSFTGTLVGPTGVAIAYEGHFNGRIDPQTGQDVISGLFRQARLPGGGLVVAAGNDYLNTLTNDVDIAGHNTMATFNTQVCAALVP